VLNASLLQYSDWLLEEEQNMRGGIFKLSILQCIRAVFPLKAERYFMAFKNAVLVL